MSDGPAESSSHDHAEIQAAVTDYLDGGLDLEQHHRFEQHLADCSDCTRYLAEIQATIAVLGRLAPTPLPETTVNSLLAAFRQSKSPPE